MEEAVNELINMLLDVEVPSKEESEKISSVNSADSKTKNSGKRWGLGRSCFSRTLQKTKI